MDLRHSGGGGKLAAVACTNPSVAAGTVANIDCVSVNVMPPPPSRHNHYCKLVSRLSRQRSEMRPTNLRPPSIPSSGERLIWWSLIPALLRRVDSGHQHCLLADYSPNKRAGHAATVSFRQDDPQQLYVHSRNHSGLGMDACVFPRSQEPPGNITCTIATLASATTTNF